jgi:uncharacterized RDD family membrane protein YckC
LKHLPALLITLITFSLMVFAIINANGNIFYIANLFVFLMAARLQSIGDLFASIVVVHKRFLDKISEELNT